MPKLTHVVVSSPLEQFAVDILVGLSWYSAAPGKLNALPLVTNINAFMLVVGALIILSYRYLGLRGARVSAGLLQGFFEVVYGFVSGLVKENTSLKNPVLKVFTPYILVVFLFILGSNFAGMAPYSYTVTSSLINTFSLALATFIGINVIGVWLHKSGFLGLFLPPGCPLAIGPLIILIETVSYGARVLSLSIRLFANMMAGHTLLAILAGFAWQMLSSGGVWLIVVGGPLLIILAVSGLEIAVAFLQTYVFTVLVCLYVRDAAELH